MLRRTLWVFLALLFLALASVLGYALLGLSGPGTAVADAEAEFRQGNFTRCIRILDQAERSLGPGSATDLRLRILSLRYRAHLRVDRIAHALADIARLRELAPDDAALARAEIRWTIASGDTQRGQDLADRYLAEHADDPEGLELAGEAAQAHYQELIRAFRAEYGRQLDHQAAREAFEAIQAWLYRDDDDPRAGLGYAAFEAILKRDRPQTFAARAYVGRLNEIRALIARSQQSFRRALEGRGEPVGAYLGLAYALRLGQRDDDLQLLAEIYLSRFDHLYAVEAAIDLVRLHLRAGRPQSAVEVADRFLPAGEWRRRVAERRLDGRVIGLYLAKADALLQLEAGDRLADLAAELEQIQEAGALELGPGAQLVYAYAARLADRPADEYDHLNNFGSRTEPSPLRTATDEEHERRIAALRRMLRISIEEGWGPGSVDNTHRRWALADPLSAEPYRERFRYRLDRGEFEGAMADLRQAMANAGRDEGLLREYVDLVDRMNAPLNRSAATLLANAVELGQPVPADADEYQLFVVAELALAKGHPRIALACAQRAAQAINWARSPRYVQAEAAFALSDPATAISAAESVLAYHPGDVRALRILRRGREASGAPSEDLIPDLLVAGVEDAETAAALLQRSGFRRDPQSAARFAGTIQREYPDDPRALLMVADMQHATGRFEDARATLHRAGNLTIERDPELFRTTFSRYFLMAVLTRGPDEVRLLFEQTVRLNQEDTQALFGLATALRQLRRPDLAYQMLLPVLTGDSHAAARTGRHFVLGGELALTLGWRDAAERHLMAALTFEDGQGASRLLTLLLLQQGRGKVAADTYWEQEARDLPSACLMARFGADDKAVGWALRTLGETPIDVPAQCIRTLFDTSFTADPALRALASAEPGSLLDVLTYADAAQFEGHSLRLAEELQRRMPGNRYAEFLLARAAARNRDDVRALELLGRLIQSDQTEPFIPAYDECVAVLNRSTSLADHQPLISEITNPEFRESGVATPRMVALATRTAAMALLLNANDRSEAIETLADAWLQFPRGTGVGLGEVSLLAAIDRVELAIRLCERIEPYLPAFQRQDFLGVYFSLVSTEVARTGDAGLLEQASRKARAVCDKEGAFGIVVHFLLDREFAKGGAAAIRADLQRMSAAVDLLHRHVALWVTRQDDNVPMLIRTLDRVAELQGVATALVVVEGILGRDPSLVEVWLSRAAWLEQQGQAESAIQGLRWLYHYAPDHPGARFAVELAARNALLTPRDEAMLAKLDQTQAESPDGRLVRGLVALRSGRCEEAAALLASAAERPDGSHLYFAALAEVGAGNTERAHELLERLALEHRSSRFAKNAAFFARQLDPR